MGSGSVVTKFVPPYAVVVGCPAKIVAVKFSKADILKHEEKIYPINERMTLKELDVLFEKYYNDVKPLNTYSYSENDKMILEGIANRLELNISL